MEKKNTLLLTVIAVATLLVAVVGATFAYFGSFSVDTEARAGVNVNTAASKASAFVTSSANIDLEVPADKMVKGTGTELAVGTYTGERENATLNISLTTDEGVTTTTVCTYVIKYAYDSEVRYGTGTYTTDSTQYTATTAPKSDGLGDGKNEFTYTLSFGAGTSASTNTASTGGTDGIKLEADYTIDTESDFSVFSAATKTAPVTIATGRISSKGNTVVQSLNVNVKFYNFPTVNQSQLADKKFSGSFYADTVDCTSVAA